MEYCLPETFNVTCAADEIIMMTSALYGRMRSGRCIKQNYGHMGCEADVMAFADNQCSGRRRCQFDVARLLGVAAPCPADVTSYLDATHRCVKGETAATALTRSGVVSLAQSNRNSQETEYAHKTRICAAEMAVRYAALSACRKVHP